MIWYMKTYIWQKLQFRNIDHIG